MQSTEAVHCIQIHSKLLLGFPQNFHSIISVMHNASAFYYQTQYEHNLAKKNIFNTNSELSEIVKWWNCMVCAKPTANLNMNIIVSKTWFVCQTAKNVVCFFFVAIMMCHWMCTDNLFFRLVHNDRRLAFKSRLWQNHWKISHDFMVQWHICFCWLKLQELFG